jgi:NADH:ubiquinone oxidoreductase subunit 6 (subunit J)
MLTRGMVGMPRSNAQAQSAAVLAALLFVAFALLLGPQRFDLPGLFGGSPRSLGGVQWPITTEPVGNDYIKAFGEALVDPTKYALPFELASVLILLAMVGAIWIARERRPAEVVAEREVTAREDAEDMAREDALERKLSGAVSPTPETALAADHH